MCECFLEDIGHHQHGELQLWKLKAIYPFLTFVSTQNNSFWLEKAIDAFFEHLEFRDLHSPSQVRYSNSTVLTVSHTLKCCDVMAVTRRYNCSNHDAIDINIIARILVFHLMASYQYKPYTTWSHLVVYQVYMKMIIIISRATPSKLWISFLCIPDTPLAVMFYLLLTPQEKSRYV